MTTHKKVVLAIKEYKNKIDPLREVVYSFDDTSIEDAVNEIERLGLIFSIVDVQFADGDYNQIVKYGYTFIDKVGLSEEEVLNAEEEMLFIAGTLEDYLLIVHDIEAEFEVADMNSFKDRDNEQTEIALDGFFTVYMKRRASAWSYLRANA